MHLSPVDMTDFYKTGHIRQYPTGTTEVYSNFTCRSDAHARMLPDFDHKTVVFGLQGICKWLLRDLWNEEFFSQPKERVVAAYERRMDASLGAGAVATDHIEALHDLGYLPLRIKALPEGSRVKLRVPLFTIVNTLPEFYWLTNYVETQLSASFWKSVTSATTAYEYRRLLDAYARKTGSAEDFVLWQGHDFSARGMSGFEDATLSGAAHLLSFYGTDTITAIDYVDTFYKDADEGYLIGGSVPATEHSVMCMGGELDEIETFRNLITKVYPGGIVSIVSDTWDLFQVVTSYAATLKGEILARTPNALGQAKVVFRPDSGDPVRIVCGDPDAADGSPESKGVVECLWEIFGGTTTATGHRLLDSHVGVIYGDSITLPLAAAILEGLHRKRFSSGNMVFGVGSYTYQGVTRDTLGTAMKATFGVVDGEDRNLYKKPKTDNGVKNSAKGLLRVECVNGEFVLYEEQTREQEAGGVLRTVFEDGKIVAEEPFSVLRERLAGDARRRDRMA